MIYESNNTDPLLYLLHFRLTVTFIKSCQFLPKGPYVFQVIPIYISWSLFLFSCYHFYPNPQSTSMEVLGQSLSAIRGEFPGCLQPGPNQPLPSSAEPTTLATYDKPHHPDDLQRNRHETNNSPASHPCRTHAFPVIRGCRADSIADHPRLRCWGGHIWSKPDSNRLRTPGQRTTTPVQLPMIAVEPSGTTPEIWTPFSKYHIVYIYPKRVINCT